MGVKKLKVILLRHTPNPQGVVAMGAKLCYSAAGITDLEEDIMAKSQNAFLERLMEMGHLTPFEHASFTFGIEGVSRSLLAQITRHRIASVSVKSQRYVSAAGANQEGNVFGYIIPPRIAALGPEAIKEFASQMAQMQKWYDGWVEKLGNYGESANEDARFVLPNAAETKMVVTMNARELLHFFNLRCCHRAQWEIRALAEEMLRLVRMIAPVIFRDAGPRCLRGPCPEGKKSCGRLNEVRERYKHISRTT